jgi:muconolactone delta-isomerase
MKIVALERELPNSSTQQFQQYAKDEARRVWELTQSGVIRESYFRADRNEAVLVLECVDVDEAQKILANLPFVQNDLIAFELIPLKAYPSFERLFTTG